MLWSLWQSPDFYTPVRRESQSWQSLKSQHFYAPVHWQQLLLQNPREPVLAHRCWPKFQDISAKIKAGIHLLLGQYGALRRFHGYLEGVDSNLSRFRHHQPPVKKTWKTWCTFKVWMNMDNMDIETVSKLPQSKSAKNMVFHAKPSTVHGCFFSTRPHTHMYIYIYVYMCVHLYL